MKRSVLHNYLFRQFCFQSRDLEMSILCLLVCSTGEANLRLTFTAVLASPFHSGPSRHVAQPQLSSPVGGQVEGGTNPVPQRPRSSKASPLILHVLGSICWPCRTSFCLFLRKHAGRGCRCLTPLCHGGSGKAAGRAESCHLRASEEPGHSLLTSSVADRAAGSRVPCHAFSPQRGKTGLTQTRCGVTQALRNVYLQ